MTIPRKIPDWQGIQRTQVAIAIANKDYSFQQLPDADFRNQDLRGANFRHAYLHKADFTGADLRNADFTGADLRQSTFVAALIDRVSFDRADLTGSDCLQVQEDEDITPKKKFRVFLSRLEQESIEVLATSKDDAEEKALKEFSDDWEVERVVEIQEPRKTKLGGES